MYKGGRVANIYPWLFQKLMKSNILVSCPYCNKRYDFPEMTAHLRLLEGELASEAERTIISLMLEVEVDENGDPVLDTQEEI